MMLSGRREGDWELLAVRAKSSAMSLEITAEAGGQQGGKGETRLSYRSKEPSRQETRSHKDEWQEGVCHTPGVVTSCLTFHSWSSRR